MRGVLLAAVILLGQAAGSPAGAKTVSVEMRNFVPGMGAMVFNPPYVALNPGDTVIFKAVDKGHNVVAIPGMTPAGSGPISGKIGQDVSVTLTKPGLYAVKCSPHYSMGMVALLNVGSKGSSVAPASALASMPALARKRLTLLLEKAK